MSDKFKPPRKQLPRRSLLPEPSGESSTNDEANEVERKVPFKVPLIMRPRPFGYIDGDDSTDSEATDSEEPTDEDDSSDEDDSTVSDATSPEELKDTAKKNDDAVNEPPNKKRRLDRRKIKTPRRFISPEAEVNQTDANP
ncbi:Uncharacterized protein Rs2_13648 [Raphanus sativus]|nr:Uncharacterized protein Rs2_13648 [Raphanus sativus]